MSNLLEQVPNSDLEFLAKKEEPRLLSILLKDKNSLADCISFGIKQAYFWIEENGWFYRVICDNYKKYSSLLTRNSIDSIMDMQETYTDEQKSARKMFWDKIYHLESSSDDYNFLKNAINSRYIQRQAYNILKENLDTIIGSTSGQTDIIRTLRQKINALEGVDADSYTVVLDMNEGMQKAFQHIINRRDNPNELAGVFCGIEPLDNIFYGFMPGSYSVITGMPGGGKTTLMFNMAFNMAKAGYSVIYISMEKEAVPFYVRLLALHANVDYNRIKRGGKADWGITEPFFAALTRAKNDVINNIKPNFRCIQMAPGTKLSKILAEVERARDGKKLDALYVDYLGVIGFETTHPTRPDLDLADISVRLQSYGKSNKVAVITAAQLKASSTKEIRKKAKGVDDDNAAQTVVVNTEDMGGSQKMAFDADNSMGIVLSKDVPPTKAYVHISKARDNQAFKTVVLDFDGRVGRISDPNQSGIRPQDPADLIYKLGKGILKEDEEEPLFAASKSKSKPIDNLEANTDTIEKIEDERGKSEEKSAINASNVASTPNTSNVPHIPHISNNDIPEDLEEVFTEQDENDLERVGNMFGDKKSDKSKNSMKKPSATSTITTLSPDQIVLEDLDFG